MNNAELIKVLKTINEALDLLNQRIEKNTRLLRIHNSLINNTTNDERKENA